MSRLWVLCALVSGCIYADPINQRPSVGIERIEPTGEIFRKSSVKLKANYDDPEGQIVWFGWRAYACTDATPSASGARPGCDQVPFFTGVLEDADFIVPSKRADEDVPVAQVLVLLQGEDDYGATSKPTQELLLSISNSDPLVRMSKDNRPGYVVDQPLNVYAKVSDPDDGPLSPTLVWDVFSPQNQPLYDFVDFPNVQQDPLHPEEHQIGKTFTPHGVGDWEIQLVATDPLGATFEDSVTITVVPDSPPCIAQVAPIVAPAGNALPISAPTLFQVNVVTDDLDPFPTTADPVLGTSAFHWSILPPGASARQTLSATGNAVPLDPTNYAPGDIVELRVEIADRAMIANNTQFGCADNVPTCSIISTSCIQRLTWRVEVH